MELNVKHKMTKKEKQLLLKDLCARLPYNMQGEGVYEEEVWHNGFPHIKKIAGHIEGIDHIGFDDDEIYITIEGIPCELCDVKLYLRPMSSMTKSEWKEYEKAIMSDNDTHTGCVIGMDFLNEHCFDYRGLIPMGLAVPTPEGMYETKIE